MPSSIARPLPTKSPCVLRSKTSTTTVNNLLLPCAAFPEQRQNAKTPPPCAPSTIAHSSANSVTSQPAAKSLKRQIRLPPSLPPSQPGLAVRNHTLSVQPQPVT